MIASAYYNCINANDKELAGEARFLSTICPAFVSLPRLFEVIWQRRRPPGGGWRHSDIAELRLDTIREVRNILEVFNTAVYPNV
jgi:hypothetical protein